MKINRLKRVLFFVLLLNVCSILIIHSSSAAPPTADAGGPYTGDEGSGITVSGAGSSDPDNDIVLYEWDLDNDGQYDDATGVTATFNATDNGSFTVGLRVTDAENNMATDTATVDVTNVAPTASITGAPASSPEGTKIDLTSAVTDPSSADTAAGFTYAWSVTKNGNPFGSGSSAGFSFTPDDNATYAVTLNVTDKDNGTSPPDSKTITVTNVAPTASIGGAPTSSPEGTKIDLTSTVTDPSSVDTTAGFTYAWSVTKNGNPFGSGSSAGFNFTPDDNATYAVTLNVKDKDTGTGTDSKTITVTNVAPTASIMGAPASGPEGTKIDLTSTVTDPSSVDTAAGFTYVWSVTKNGNPFASGTNPTLSFTPDDNATYAVTLNVKDKDTGTGTDSKTITVTNVAPTVSISGAPTSSPEGTKIDLTSTVTDPSSADTTAGFTYAWSVTKNGNPFASGTNPTLSFTPDDNGTYAVTFSVKDKDNGTGTDNKTITVTNVVPTISSVTNTGPVTEGSPISVTFTITDPGADTWDYFVDWNNDGDFLDTDESVTGSTQKTVTLTHTYPDDFTASIPVKVADKDGGADTSKTTLITVNNVPPPSTA